VQYSWTKLDAHDQDLKGWGVRAAAYGGNATIATGLSGQTVLVEAKSGATKHVTLGQQVLTWNGGRVAIYAVAAAEKQGRTVKQAAVAADVVSGASAIRQAAVAARTGAGRMTRYQNDWAESDEATSPAGWRAPDAAAPEPPARKLSPSKDAARLPDGTFDAYDILVGTPGVPGRYRTIERGVEFLVDAWYPSWWPTEDEAQTKPGFDTPVECALAWLAEEGRVLQEQYAYERSHGWSTD